MNNEQKTLALGALAIVVGVCANGIFNRQISAWLGLADPPVQVEIKNVPHVRIDPDNSPSNPRSTTPRPDPANPPQLSPTEAPSNKRGTSPENEPPSTDASDPKGRSNRQEDMPPKSLTLRFCPDPNPSGTGLIKLWVNRIFVGTLDFNTPNNRCLEYLFSPGRINIKYTYMRNDEIVDSANFEYDARKSHDYTVWPFYHTNPLSPKVSFSLNQSLM